MRKKASWFSFGRQAASSSTGPGASGSAGAGSSSAAAAAGGGGSGRGERMPMLQLLTGPRSDAADGGDSRTGLLSSLMKNK